MIPSPPIGLASIAAYARDAGFSVGLIDAFGLDPFRTKIYQKEFVLIGLDVEDIVQRIHPSADVIGISVHSAMVAKFCLDLGIKLKKKLSKPVIVGGPHITLNFSQFTNRGIDYAVVGEGERPLVQLVKTIMDGGSTDQVSGVTTDDREPIQPGEMAEMDELPIPAWDLVPLKNYWRTRINHSPFKGRFIPMISSRGCPFKCTFCTTPLTSRGKWRAFSAERVVQEIKTLYEIFKTEDFIIQDDNFSANPERAGKICTMIKQEGLPVRLSLPSGVRLETLSAELMKVMGEGGLCYLSLSPESGSKRIRKLMRKPLNEKKLYDIIKQCVKLNIRTGICFIIGNPGETVKDILQTAKMIAKTILYGADDISVFIFSPLPGAPLAKEFEKLFPKDFLGLCWTPKWRSDYSKWAFVRYLLYMEYLLLKILFQPREIWRSLLNVLDREFETKGEMGAARLISNYLEREAKSWPVKPL